MKFFLRLLVLAGCVVLARAEVQVHLKARVYEVAPGATVSTLSSGVGLVDQHSLLLPVGTQVSSSRGRHLICPSEYLAPRLGQEVVSQLEDAEVWAGLVDPALDGDVIIPQLPRAFAARETGLTIRARTERDEQGEIRVHVEVEDRWFHDLANMGEEIAARRTGALGKEKYRVLSANRKLEPLVEPWWEEVSLVAGGEKVMVEIPARVEVQRLARLVVLEAKRFGSESVEIEEGMIPELESRSWPFPEAMRQVFASQGELGDASADALAARLTNLGMRVGSADFDEEGNFVVRAPAASLERIDRLFHVVGSGTQIVIAAKFIESSEPLDAQLKPVMTDAEAQAFVRAAAQSDGVDMMSCPSVVTLPWQKAKIEVAREFQHPVSFEPLAVVADADGVRVTPPQPSAFLTHHVGVSLEVESFWHEDHTVGLSVAPQVLEFEGVVDYGNPALQVRKRRLGKPQVITLSENRMEMPVFFRRRLTSHARIPEGSWVVLGGMTRDDLKTVKEKIPLLGDVPFIGNLFSRKGERADRNMAEEMGSRFIYFMVSARAIGAAGQDIPEDSEG